MSKQKVGIVVECSCALPISYLRRHNVDMIYFLIKTDSGVFSDTDEVTADNIIEYMQTNEKMPVSSPPDSAIYKKIFRKNLLKYEEVIFISSSSEINNSYQKAVELLESMGTDSKKLHIFDSKTISTGIGHIVVKAVELAESGLGAEEIITQISEYRECISSSFIASNIEYLYYNKLLTKNQKILCDLFNFFPVFEIKNGTVKVKRLIIGKFDKVSMRYVRNVLKKDDEIDKKRIFITHSGCSIDMIEQIKAEVNKNCQVDEIIVTKASASASCNYGSEAFGIFFVKKDK